MTLPEAGDTVTCEILTVDGREEEIREVEAVRDGRVYFQDGEHQQTFVPEEAFDVGLWEVA